MSKKAAFISIGIAAMLWGIIGLFVSQLYELGFNAIQIVTVRTICATIFMAVYAFLKNKQLLKIKLKDSRYFVGTGVFSVVLFNLCLFIAIKETSISVATILLYTAPAFVTILSRFFFKEELTLYKVLALCTTLSGCTLVVGIMPGSQVTISTQGLLLGLGAGFFYALYSIFGKYALRKYDSITVSLYTFIFASLAIVPFNDLGQILALLRIPEAWIYILGLSFFSTALAFLLYTKGLHYVESSKASIIATLEPVVAALIGLLVYHENLSFSQYIGVALVISAVVLVQIPSKKASGV